MSKGINMEHSPFDGHTCLRFAEDTFNYSVRMRCDSPASFTRYTEENFFLVLGSFLFFSFLVFVFSFFLFLQTNEKKAEKEKQGKQKQKHGTVKRKFLAVTFLFSPFSPVVFF